MLPFSDRLEPRTILELLSRSLPYYIESWHPIDDAMGIFGVSQPQSFNMQAFEYSSPVIEYVIRPHLQVCCILASYIGNEEDALVSIGSGVDKSEIIRMVVRGLAWACETHVTGSIDVEHFLERKRWGENWRSSLWASMMGLCVILCQKHIPADILEKIRKILAFEADRFIDVAPPSGCHIDTKLEENAIDSLVMAWAMAINTGHPHEKLWEQSLSIWAINIASCIQDKADHGEYRGSSAAKFVSTENLYPDMTAENHGFFHPDILSYGMWIVLAKAAFKFTDKEPPACLRRKNHQKTFDILLRFCLPNGMLYAPAGQDLPVFFPRPFALAWGLLNNDPRAHSLTVKLLSWMDSFLVAKEHNTGPWVFGFEPAYEGWELLFQSQVGFELALLAVIPYPMEFGVFSVGQLENAVETRHIYPYVEVCYRRNVRVTRSVAWKALGGHPMIGLSVHSYPELIFPDRAGLLGIPSTVDPIKQWDVAFHNDHYQRDGFDTCGRIRYFSARGEALLSREVRVLTWGDDGLVVFDRVSAEKDVGITDQFLSPLYIVNDFWTKNHIDFMSGSLRETFFADQQKCREVDCPSPWASIGNSLLFQFVWGREKGLVYVPSGKRNTPPYWKNCRLDMLAVRLESRSVKAGETVYQAGFFVGAGIGPRPFKCAGEAGEFFSGLVIMDGKNTVGFD
jgi:hypothetical protein